MAQARQIQRVSWKSLESLFVRAWSYQFRRCKNPLHCLLFFRNNTRYPTGHNPVATDQSTRWQAWRDRKLQAQTTTGAECSTEVYHSIGDQEEYLGGGGTPLHEPLQFQHAVNQTTNDHVGNSTPTGPGPRC